MIRDRRSCDVGCRARDGVWLGERLTVSRSGMVSKKTLSPLHSLQLARFRR